MIIETAEGKIWPNNPYHPSNSELLSMLLLSVTAVVSQLSYACKRFATALTKLFELINYGEECRGVFEMRTAVF